MIMNNYERSYNMTMVFLKKKKKKKKKENMMRIVFTRFYLLFIF
jgi:hypothetical protein